MKMSLNRQHLANNDKVVKDISKKTNLIDDEGAV